MSTDHGHDSHTHTHHDRSHAPHDIPKSRRLGRAFFCLLTAAVVALALASSFVFVDEAECVIVERLGHITAVYDRPDDCGLHGKLPWPISTARRFDRRTQLFDPPGREVFTADKKNITIDTYVCWRIAAPEARDLATLTDRPVVRFFRALGSRDVAEARLDSRVRSILSTRIGSIELSSLMRVTDPESAPDDQPAGLLDQISTSVRDQVIRRPDETQSIRERLGVEVVDVRIKRINFPSGNQQAVFERMKSERRKIADRYRSAGMAENTVIKSQADRQYNEILAKADADAERIRGQGEAEATTILNAAHAQDPEFYRVQQTLDTYRTILNERTTLVLSASSELLKLLTQGVPKLETVAPSGQASGAASNQSTTSPRPSSDSPRNGLPPTEATQKPTERRDRGVER